MTWAGAGAWRIVTGIRGSHDYRGTAGETFPVLRRVLHEDWPLEAESPDEVVSAFLRQRRSGPDLDHLSSSIVTFVDDHPNDDELGGALFKELGCYYSPRADGVATRTWLLGVAARLTRPSEP